MPVDQVSFSVDLGVDVDPITTIGTVYEVGIDGVGYMLADDPEKQEQRYRRTVTPLEPQRLATGDTPYTEAVQRIQFASMIDWSAGRGQSYWDRDKSDKLAYKDSFGLDTFSDPGRLKLAKVTERELADTYASLRLVVVGSVLYVQTADNELTQIPTIDGTPVPVTITDATGAIVISDLTTDGAFWYAATGASIVRGTTADPAASWSAQDAVGVQWAAGRIIAAVKGAGSSTPNIFTSLTPTGTEERTSGHLTLDTGHTIILGGAANGYFYFGSYVGGRGLLWAWKLGLDDAGEQFFPFVAWELPEGLIPISVGTGGSNVFAKLLRPSGAASGQSVLYRGVPDTNGSVTPFLIDEIQAVGGTVDHSEPCRMAVQGDQVLFPWPTMVAGRSGVGAVSLATGGYSKWLMAGDVGAVSSIDVWQGYMVMVIQGDGVWVESSDTFEVTSRLDMSVVDGKTSLTKVLDKITLHFDPLLTGQSIKVSTSTDDGVSYTLLGTANTAGAIRASFTIDEAAFSFGLRVELLGDGTATATVTMHEMQYHVIGLADTYLQLPINCADNITLLNSRPAPENGRGKGMARVRVLQNLTQTRVLFQDIDYWLTSQSEIWEVVSVDVMSTHLQNRGKGGVTAMQVAVLTLRRVGP